jgi:hypothetical protein
VPTFVIEGRWAIPGAQDVDTFAELLERARERLAPLTVGARSPRPAPSPAESAGAADSDTDRNADCDDGSCAI